MKPVLVHWQQEASLWTYLILGLPRDEGDLLPGVVAYSCGDGLQPLVSLRRRTEAQKRKKK